VARALDTALGAGGALTATWAAADTATSPAPAGPDEFERFEQALANPRRTDDAVVEHLRRMLAEQRRAEDALGPRRLLPPVLAQIEVIANLARNARGPVRRELLGVASHYDQFVAWMAQDSMNPVGATAHYDRAMEAAQEIGDDNMITSVLSLKSHLAWSVGDASRAIGLAKAGQRKPADDPRATGGATGDPGRHHGPLRCADRPQPRSPHIRVDRDRHGRPGCADTLTRTRASVPAAGHDQCGEPTSSAAYRTSCQDVLCWRTMISS